MAAGKRRLGYRAELDGVRALAAGLVVVAHFLPNTTSFLPGSGGLGVSAFFVLSGFLITVLLLEEHARADRIDLRSFWARRARRLLPALVTFVIVVWTVEAAMGHDVSRPATLTLGYVANFAAVAGEDLGPFGHAWSLAVEEHFYLVWPLVIAAVLFARRRPILVVGMLTGIATTWQLAVVLFSPERASWSTDSRAATLLAGCLLGCLFHADRLPVVRRSVVVGAGLAVTVWSLLIPLETPLTSLAMTATGLVAVLYSLNGVSWLRNARLVAVGRVSYGLYLWHYTVASWIVWPRSENVSTVGVATALTAALTAASWLLVERRWLNRPAASGQCSESEPRLSEPRYRVTSGLVGDEV